VDPDQVAEAGKIPAGAVDLRSDTADAGLRQRCGERWPRRRSVDDVYGEDPTVNRLEKRAAEIFGKEAALFVPTGCHGGI